MYAPLAADVLAGRLQRKGGSGGACAPRCPSPTRQHAPAPSQDLDADFARAAAAAPFAINLTTDFFSDRIGCQIHQPLYGISLGALCLRP